jgi:hypothetical protein
LQKHKQTKTQQKGYTSTDYNFFFLVSCAAICGGVVAKPQRGILDNNFQLDHFPEMRTDTPYLREAMVPGPNSQARLLAAGNFFSISGIFSDPSRSLPAFSLPFRGDGDVDSPE